MIQILRIVILMQIVSSAINVNAGVIQHNYIDMRYVESLSTFRSGAGHDFSYEAYLIANGFYELETDPTETNRSMKHYFCIYEQYKEDNITIPIFAPFDGVIHRVSNDNQRRGYTDKQVWIKSNANPSYFAIIFHVNLSDTFPQVWNDYPQHLWEHWEPNDSTYDRITVQAGEIIGYADTRETACGDIAMLHKISAHEYHYVSFFDPAVMPDSIFQEYVDRGVTIPMDLIISKAYRDAHPFPQNYPWGGYNPADWFILNPVPSLTPGPLLLLLKADPTHGP